MARYVTRVIDDRIPFAAFEGINLTVTIALKMLKIWKQVGVGLAAIKKGHSVAVL